jgi:hypothetical protein
MDLQDFALLKIPVVEIGTLNERDRSSLGLEVIIPVRSDDFCEEGYLANGTVEPGRSATKKRVNCRYSAGDGERR